MFETLARTARHIRLQPAFQSALYSSKGTPIDKLAKRHDIKRMRMAQSMVRAKNEKQSGTALPVIKGVIFDMDGTLTVPCIDFAEMRRRVGVLEGDILDAMSKMTEEDAQKAEDAIASVEADALRAMTAMPGALETSAMLDALKVPRGLITRNVATSVAYFHAGVFSSVPAFQPALARCFKPYKPSPAGILHICEKWSIPPEHVVMIGDSAKDDIVAGNRAGAKTILIDVERVYDLSTMPKEQQPTFHVYSMHEVKAILEEQCTLAGAAPLEGAVAA